MRDSDYLGKKFPLGCYNPLIHRIGRPPFGPYFNDYNPLCRSCLTLLISQGPALIRIAAPLQLLQPKFECNRRHPARVRAYLRVEDVPLCWDCADADLRRGAPLKLSALEPEKAP